MSFGFSLEKAAAWASPALSRFHALLSWVHWRLVASGVLLLVLVWGTVAWESQRIRQDQMNDLRGEMLHLGEVLDAVLMQQVASLDNALLILREEYLDHRAEVPRLVKLLRRDALKGLAVHVTVMGHDGYTTYSDIDQNAKPVYMGDRAHFRYFADGGVDRLYIGKPVPGRMTQERGLSLSRPLIGKKGEFLGVIAIFMPPGQLLSRSHSLDSHANTHITLATDDGTILASSVNPEQTAGIRLSEQQLNAFRLATAGVNLDAWRSDAAARVLTYRWAKKYPLLLLISHSTTSLNADVSARQRQLIILGSMASLISVLTLLLLGRSLHQRKNIEDRLKREHAHLAEAQRIARLGSWELDHTSGRLYWSDEVYRIFETGNDQAPTNYEDFILALHPDDRQAVDRAFRQSLQDHTPYRSTHRLLLPDGRVKWVHERGRTDFDANGRPRLSSGTVQDVTERKQDELARDALSRERLLLLDSTGEGIFGIDMRGLCTFVNQAAARMLGFEVKELLGRNIHQLIHYKRADGSAFPDSECPVYRTFRSGESTRTDHDVFWRKDGTGLPVEYSAHPIRDADRITGTVTVFSDISQRLRTDAEMRIAATAFETQEGMFVTDEKGAILRVNSAFTDITGYTAAEAVGMNPRFRSSGRHDADFYASMWTRISTTGSWKGEVWNRRKNGDVYPELVSITAVRGEDENVTHYVATMHDISERKAVEEQIRNLAFYDPLTSLPNRRLLQDRLIRAQSISVRSGRQGALMFIDLDKFKEVNDTLGHDVGDLLLQQVARRLQGCVRQSDTVARMGGDEFVILVEALEESAPEARTRAEQLGHKLLAALNQPYRLYGHVLHSTPSIGATLFCGPLPGYEEVLKQADLAMYQAKAAGRNQICFYDPAMMQDNALPDALASDR